MPPQTGITYGANGAGGGGRQLQFVVADAGGLLDPASIDIVYNIQTSGTVVSADDGHPFTRIQVNLNGQNLEDNAQCAKYTNAEVKLSCGNGWYRSEGSFAGFENLNHELQNGAPVAAATPVTGALLNNFASAWGCVVANQPTISARQAANVTAYNPIGGEQRCMPLGLMSGVGRMRQFLPLNTLGEINLTLFTGSAGEVVFQAPNAVNGDFSLAGVYLEYDIVVPHPALAEMLHKMANDPSEPGLNMPFESTIMAAGVTIAASDSLTETSIIVSRATQNLLRSFLVQQPTTLLNAKNYPSQSCFGHAGTYRIQWRIGSQYFPAIPAEGDASMWCMTQSAYGSANANEDGNAINRELWRTYTTAIGAGAGWTTLPTTSDGFQKFAFGDSFIPCYGFQLVKGDAEPLAVDGISLSGASGSQAVVVITSAPATAGGSVTPTVGLVALRFISAHAGSVRVLGA